jgi:beta-lactamase regulating signal transducer with metallopeptidase domain
MTGWLLGTLLATSLLIVLVLLVREPVRRRFGSRVAYGLWLIPAARLLMPTLTQTVERTVPTAAPMQPLIQPVADEPLLLTSVAPAGSSLLEQVGGWPTVLTTAWLAVATGFFLSRMIAFQRDRRAILAAGREVGTIGSIRIVQSRDVSSPIAFGILDRVIAVPAEFERLYDERERALALDHELAHHGSGDLVANFFAFVLLCLQWFNPLAWVAHAAFRFDQEAACDARVLDKAKARDRADYGRAIAKAASGRALLFASALDRRNTLKRRLSSMLTNTTAGKRTAGKLMILAAVAVALPLTATRAIDYVDIAQPAVAPAAPQAPEAPAAPLVPAVLAVQPAAPVAPTPPVPPSPPSVSMQINDDTVTINGQTKRWKDLTPAEKQHIRGEIAKAKAELARTKIDRVQIEREVREALNEAKIDKDEMRRELTQARLEIDQAMRDIDAHAADIRRSGQDPEAIRAQVRASLKAVEAIDVEAITRNALASVNPEAIAASVAAAEASVAKAQAEIERIEQRLDQDD